MLLLAVFGPQAYFAPMRTGTKGLTDEKMLRVTTLIFCRFTSWPTSTSSDAVVGLMPALHIWQPTHLRKLFSHHD